METARRCTKFMLAVAYVERRREIRLRRVE